MSLNVTVVTRQFVACTTDRRLSNSKEVVSERACKLIQFNCGTAGGLITYNGIGRSIAGETPNDWISEVMKQGQCDLVTFCDRLKNYSGPRIDALASQFNDNPRHSFVLTAFEGHAPVLGLISNYEGFDQEPLPVAGSIEVKLLTPKADQFGALVTGATHIVKRRSWDRLMESLNGRRPEREIVKLMEKIIRDTAYQDRLRGSVGSSVLTSVLHPFDGFQASGGVVGGSLVNEMPDFITASVQFRDIWFAALPNGVELPETLHPSGNGGSKIGEPRCINCGTPVPIGYRKCGGCDASAQL